ncbi:hypothetical protein A5886_002227 [Enterococcus sp. 8G7_MSG3316]|uniref:Uncharacterized protein n=1 Tax=Candidatus Enterococcus testudinis TaxID=1834191 RepID=A0A242A7X1_9ENTE|nr:hypothetical protein [Enterococcus sp. 8G7_MSG3316]OTN77147.1 hypothetical protein A5886_002227 [Enterococcus sp. 8G7_MSG3316]
MTIRDLDALPQAVKQTFDPDFVFLIAADKIQHFPARQWSETAYQQMLEEKLGSSYDLFIWQEMLVARGATDLLVLMPKYHDLEAFAKTPHQLN